ncbi:Fur family transcriptional regulator [Bifidobacterium bohemicum]|uniref:Putative Ferric uptake regulation protein n=1 Tax=Bifidobacterium bohemicum DSM 22767 TaxID=1437606 RepID=A0A086ZFY8_9BIFI|nr:Fur family transcriptional regulator [Bifidobacterium bohemicum]KFI45438.1 putative Ferric uptake regulation protein [Bifidobacterium bohemicum DSM 22767]
MTVRFAPTKVRRTRQHNTWQQDTIMQELSECEDFVSAQDLHRRLSEGGSGIGLSTVYRQLNALADAGRIDAIQLSGQQVFRICMDGRHHHHLVCEACGNTVEIEPPEQWLRQIAEQHGYSAITHTIEIFGLCPECRSTMSDEDQAAYCNPRH